MSNKNLLTEVTIRWVRSCDAVDALAADTGTPDVVNTVPVSCCCGTVTTCDVTVCTGCVVATVEVAGTTVLTI